MLDRTQSARRRCCALLSVAAIASPAVFAETIAVNPRGTYLRTNADAPVSPAIISLNSLGIVPGDQIRVAALGDFSVGSGFGDSTVSMIGVFSASAQLLGAGEAARVPAAVDAGDDYVTDPTWVGALPTDIPQDFAIGFTATSNWTNLVVPVDATHLIVGILDSFYGDNADADGDLAVGVTLVPEPASLALLGIGAAVLRRRR